MKASTISTLLLSSSLLFSCQNISTSESDRGNEITSSEATTNTNNIVSRIVKLNDNKTYLEVDGKPYTLIGAQIRIDGLMNRDEKLTDAPSSLSYEQMRPYFKKAKECGINTLQLPIDWKDIEISKDVYDFTQVKALLDCCNEFDLKCEFLWFSTNMCGDSHSFHIPDYIFYNEEEYPHIQAKSPYFSSMYGDVDYLVLNNPSLMERERKVLQKIMEYVVTYNRQNGNKNPLIGFQVHNEADGLLRWRLDQQKLKMNDMDMTPEKIWEMTLQALDNAGQAIKNSTYQIYTRCNMTVTLGVEPFPQFSDKSFSPLDVLALKGIDMIGDDPYNVLPHAINQTIRKYNVNNNYPHIAENMGDYDNSPSLFLSAYQAGGCYMFYDFATPQYFNYINQNGSYHMDQGLLNDDLSYKNHSLQTISIIKGIGKMGSVLPLIDSSDFAIFNVLSQYPKENFTQEISTSKLKITYTSKKAGVAFAISQDEYLYIYSNEDASFILNDVSFIYKADIGYFSNDTFIVEKSEIINPVIE
ncbi:MAG: DUF4978 domain-containing protein, partial [Erysipelotrichaceae bacterium]|nr:DUF4978 domain-containing protein [Erysipelotrichaceae bacterium]